MSTAYGQGRTDAGRASSAPAGSANTSRGTLLGIAIGAVLGFAALLFGFWGFLLVALLMLIGGLVGRVFEGTLDLRSLGDVLRGRSTSR